MPDATAASLPGYCAVCRYLTTLSMMYVAEVSLRTSKPLQLSGLAGSTCHRGRWLVFAAIAINGTGALIGYAAGSGEL